MIEHNRTSLEEKQLTNINRLCEEYSLLAYQSTRAHNRGFHCEIHKQFEPGLPEVYASPQDLGRAVSNILKNAFEAVHERRLHEQESGATVYQQEVFLSTYSKNKSVVIAIRDNGVGIPASIREKIFLPFFTTHESSDGSGLGLSMANEIVRAHGGELAVHSEENQFTEFIITLPL